jgi:RNA polymerase sigma factor (sigma-70 family)
MQSVIEPSSAPSTSIDDLLSEGGASSLAEVFERLRAPLLGKLGRILCQEDLEDAIQEAFLKLLRCSGEFDPGKGPGTAWIHKVVWNTALDLRRQHRRRARRVRSIHGREAEAPAKRTDPAALAVEREAKEALSLSLEGLPEEVHSVLISLFYEGKTLKDVSEAMACSTSAAFRRKTKGLASLHAALDP